MAEQKVETRTANSGNVLLSGIPQIDREIGPRLRPYQNTRFATMVDWDARGEAIYISTRFADVPQLHRVDRPLGIRRQLTFGGEPLREAWRRPGSDELLYAMDVGGGEFHQLHLFDPRGGQERRLTDGRSRNTEPTWSPDGRNLAFTSTRRDGRANDIWIVEPERPEDARLALAAPDGSAWVAVDWHPSRPLLLVQQYVSITDSRVHLLDLESGELRRVAGDDEEGVAYTPIAFDATGDGIFLTSDRTGEFVRLERLDPRSGEAVAITESIDWNVEFTDISSDRRWLAFTTNENGASRVHLLETSTLRFRTAEEVPLGVAYGLKFDPTGRRLGFTFDAGVAPSDVFTLDLDPDVGGLAGLTRWTESELGGLSPSTFVAPRPIHFPSFDGRDIPALLYLPKGDRPRPVVINIHGGPEGQARPVFSSVFQSWIAELGVAVLDPNVRGSSGYGKSYLKLDNGMLREDSVRDIGALLDWIASHPELDENRVMVYGGSYGGYMVLASLLHFGDRLRAGIDIVGISDFITFLENTQDYRRDLRRVEYGDERDPEMRAFFERISPLRNAHRIASPLFVIQGQNDPRVSASEAEQIVAQVRANGREVWYMNALNEGHGYARKENQDLMREAVVMFMGRHLGD